MLSLKFEKTKAQRYLDCFDKGQSFEPEDKEKGWGWDELLCLAGVIFYKLVIDESCRLRDEKKSKNENSSLTNSLEHSEMRIEKSINDVCGAIIFTGNTVGEIVLNEYDKKWPPIFFRDIIPQGEQPEIKTSPRSMRFNQIL